MWRPSARFEGVEAAEGGYSADFLHNTEDDQRVLHVMGEQKKMNRITVSEGRMPETVGECLVDDASDYQIGDEIILTSGTEDPVSDTLATDTLTVVGQGQYFCLRLFWKRQRRHRNGKHLRLCGGAGRHLCS